MLGKGHGGLYKAPTKEEKRKRRANRLRGERDQIEFIDLRFERWQVVGLSELCCGKAMVAYKKPQWWKKDESERLRGERDQIKFIDLRFERWQVVRFRFYATANFYEDKNKVELGGACHPSLTRLLLTMVSL